MASYRLKNTGKREGDNAPQFSLSYKPEGGESKSDISYEILSALKKDRDVVIEINTSLILDAKRSIPFSPEKFLSQIRNLNLVYSYRKSQRQGKPDFFSFLFGGKRDEDCHEIIFYVPDDVWKAEAIKKILPTFGVKYYIKDNSGNDAHNVLDEMNRLTDKEKADYFSYVIFDVAEFNQMGISSNQYGSDDIKEALGI
ncbi:MAG: hypothetical protein ACOYIF_12225 [Acetivibrionales bacterium]|jgi:hypothetical protein